jgi:hypothetical protein
MMDNSNPETALASIRAALEQIWAPSAKGSRPLISCGRCGEDIADCECGLAAIVDAELKRGARESTRAEMLEKAAAALTRSSGNRHERRREAALARRKR